MARDQDIVKRLQQRLKIWDPDGECKYHSRMKNKQCEYDAQGQLIMLHLCQLGLEQIPSELWSLTSLQKLYLNSNQLSSLPFELGNLSSLQHLSLAYNQLSTLSPEIGNLSSLQRLDLDHNQLSTLPPELSNLPFLQKLYLDNNPLHTPPPEIIAQGTEAILVYLQTQQEQTFPQNPTLSQPLNTIDIFYSYEYEDEMLRKELEKHLSNLRSQRLITDWHDRNITAGTDWQQTTSSYLDKAHLILLLVSPDFMASEYRYGREMQRAMQRHANGEARVVPILLRPVDWKGTPFATLQILPSTGEPITRWPDRDEAFVNVVTGIRKVVEEILEARLQSFQQKIQATHLQRNILESNYSHLASSLSSLSNEQEHLAEQCKSIEEEIHNLQTNLLILRQHMAKTQQVQEKQKYEIKVMRQDALKMRKIEVTLRQEAQILLEQINRLKQ